MTVVDTKADAMFCLRAAKQHQMPKSRTAFVTFRPNQMLIWAAKGPAGTSGAHAWYIEPTPGGCHVVTEEAQRGLLLFFIGGRTRGTLLNSHQEWLRALKAL
jgi:hypothetical protein